MPMRRIQPGTRQHARTLRKPLTPTEQRLWACVRSAQLEGLKFRRQHPIGSYIADFYCAAARLILEIDGDSHAAQVEYDQERTRWLESQGYRVIRFTNREVQEDLAAVAVKIIAECHKEARPKDKG